MIFNNVNGNDGATVVAAAAADVDDGDDNITHSNNDNTLQ